MNRRPLDLQTVARLLRFVVRLRSRGAPLWLLAALGILVVAAALLWPQVAGRLAGLSGDGGGGDRPPMAADSRGSGEPPAGSDSGATLEGVADWFREVRPDTFESPAGLRYRPGSAQGHRLRHVLAHARDQPSRAGPHGVFDAAEPLAVFRLIDDAYHQALADDGVTVSREEGRTIYTVDLGRRIGYVGGEAGNRRGRPAARRLRLVLAGKNVITAFPVE